MTETWIQQFSCATELFDIAALRIPTILFHNSLNAFAH